MCRKKEVSKDPRPDTPVFPAAELAAPAYGYYPRNNPQQQRPERRRQRINQQPRNRAPYYNQYYKQ